MTKERLRRYADLLSFCVGGLFPTLALAHRAFPEPPIGDALERYEVAVVDILCLEADKNFRLTGVASEATLHVFD